MESDIRRIKQYIVETKMEAAAETGYQMCVSEMMALSDEAERDTSGMICQAFFYGKAKGYRAGKGIQDT